MKTLKRSICLLLLLFMLSGTAAALASGDPIIDFSRTGSLSISLTAGDTAVSGAELTVYRVADAQSIGGNLGFTFTEAYAGFGGAPEDLTDTDDVLRLVDYTNENGIAGISGSTDASGFVEFVDLELGLYLVVQTGSVEGFTDCTPFLVMIPVQEGDVWVYDIDATPKTDILRLIDLTVRKVWNDGKESIRPESITVQLLDGETVVDTVTLSEQNGWSYTWENLPESDSYSVREIDAPEGYHVSYQQDGYVFIVTNTSGLVQTGQLIWPIPVLAVSGLVLFAVGVLLYRRKKGDA